MQLKRRRIRDDYLDLVWAFALRPIRSRAEHEAAIKVLTRLLGRPVELSEGERDYAEALTRFVKDYEAGQALPSREQQSPLERLQFLMELRGMNTEALGKVLGTQTAASLLLNGKRELSKAHIRKLAAFFKVDPGLFI